MQKQYDLIDRDQYEEEEEAASAKPMCRGAPGELPPSDSEEESSEDKVSYTTPSSYFVPSHKSFQSKQI